MERNLLLLMTVLLLSLHSFGQSIWTNPITGANPQTENPYITGQTKDVNITVSGVRRGSSLTTTILTYANTFAAKDWTMNSSIELNDYFEFTLTPNACYRINFLQFVFAASKPNMEGPINFAVRSSVDNYTSNIGTVTATGATINLAGAAYQNIFSAITFRVYGWGNTNNFSGVWGIDSFSFTGNVSSVIAPTITTTNTPAVVTPVCKSVVNQTTTLAYSATANTPINYSIDWNNAANSAGLADQGITAFAFSAIGGNITGILVPSAAAVGTYSGVMTINSGNCTSTRNVTLTIAGDNTVVLTSGAGTNNQTRCVNTAVSNITFGTTGATGATVSGLPAGISGSWNANVFTISGTPTVAGSFPYTITLTGGCGNVTTSGTITVTAANTVALTSGAGTNNQTRCVSTTLSNITFGTTGATGATVAGLPAGVSGSWNANVFTISGTPTTSGSFPYTVTLTGGCGNVTTSGTIAVSAPNTVTLTSGAGTNSQTRCVNTALSNITFGTTGATGATFAGLPAGVSGSWSGNVVTISGTPTASGSFPYTVTLTGGCGNVTTTGTITVNALPVAPTITAGGATTFCAGGSVTLTSSVGTSYLWSTGATTQSINVSALGSYTVRVTNANGCQSLSSVATVVTVNPVPVITSQPINQLDCRDSFVTFKVVASGVGLNYTWQYKRPSDGSFITLNGTETNTTYPSTGEIRIGNVGSAQYPDGTLFQAIVANANCSLVSSAVTLSVNSITDIFPITTDVTRCYGANYTYTVSNTYPGNVVSYQWKKSVASGIWDNIIDGGVYSGANTASLTITGGTPAETAEYRVFITFNNSTTQCSVDSSTRTRKITFLPQLTTPVTTITQPTCLTPSGTITVTIQSATDTYSFDNGANFQSSNVKSGLGAGFYNVIIKNSQGCLSPVANCEIIGETSWNGTSWSHGTPTSDQVIVFDGNFTSTGDVNGCNCLVKSGIVTINSGHTLTITNAVTVTAGSLIFEDDASLVQVNDAAVNSGNITYKRNTSIARYDYTYWSSPVAGFTLKQLSPSTLYDRYFSYNPDTGWDTVINGAAVMQLGQGYIVRGPQDYSTTLAAPFAGNFIGIPNNGTFNNSYLTVVSGKNYLLGNPYPSAIDADKFLDLNAAILQGTLYFWTHNTPPAATGTTMITYKYSAADYASYNKTGGVGTSGTGTGAASGGIVPNGKIASGQGFFASATGNGNVVFNNTMRISGGTSGTDNAQFFRLNSNSKIVKMEKNRIWLNLTNSEGAFKQTLIGYITGATNDYDNGFDGISFNGNQYVDFYSVSNNKNLTIQGRALPFVKNDSVALGYNTTVKGEFRISIDYTDGSLSTQDIFLEDKELKVQHNLKKTAYTFVTEEGVFNNRFVLRYQDKNNLERTNEEENTAILVSVREKKITINSNLTALDRVSIYDSAGRKLFQKNKIEANTFVISDFISIDQVLIVDVVLLDGSVYSRKIIYY